MRKLVCVLSYLFSFLFLTVPLFAENNFSFRIAPTIEAPLGLSHFSSGIGVSASLDWSFYVFLNDFDVGVSAGGAFASLPMQTGDPLILLEGKGGAFVRYRPFDRWAFRAGFNAGAYQYSRADESAVNPLISFGLGAEYHLSPYFSLFTEGAYIYRAFSSEPLPSISAALGLRVNISEIMGGRARVQMEKTEQYRVFPVSWAWYENNPVATVIVTNEEPNTITNLNLSFFMERFMSEPWIFATIQRLDPGESIEVPVTALFNEAMTDLSQSVNANGVLQMHYRSLGARKEAVTAIQMPIFQRNNMSWDDDRRAAAFVSPRDNSARYFARYVAGAVESAFPSGTSQGNTPRNVLYAQALFEALRLYRINYVVDPSSSYVLMSEDETSVDNLNYPYETLYYRGGECDDLSILFCSMLEALDIESAFITVPGHLYTAFAIGSDTWQANNADIIVIDGKRWMPMEVTITGRGFTQGWSVGARQWRTAGKNAALYPIRECWEIYPSVTVPASVGIPTDMPEWADIIRALR